MNDKLKNRILCAGFVLITAGGFLLHLICPDKMLSISERRRLAQASEVTLTAVLGGKFATSFDDYALDQFPGRDSFRTLKAIVQYYVLRQKDNNGVFLAEGNIGKLEFPLSESSALRAAEKFMSLKAQYFPIPTFIFRSCRTKAISLRSATAILRLIMKRWSPSFGKTRKAYNTSTCSIRSLRINTTPQTRTGGRNACTIRRCASRKGLA